MYFVCDLPFLSWHYFKNYSNCCLQLWIVHSHCWLRPQFIYLFYCWWTFELFTLFGIFKQCLQEHSCSCTVVHINVYLQGKDLGELQSHRVCMSSTWLDNATGFQRTSTSIYHSYYESSWCSIFCLTINIVRLLHFFLIWWMNGGISSWF